MTKQEIALKTASSYRVLPIPDYVFAAILEEQKKYEKNRSRRKKEFQDLDYICCSSYGRPRSMSYHFPYFKKLLKENGLPDIHWHDLRSRYCTLLLRQNFSPKAVSRLMGHAKEIVTVDVYGDRALVADCVPELTAFIKEVLPKREEREQIKMPDVVVDIQRYLGEELQRSVPGMKEAQQVRPV